MVAEAYVTQPTNSQVMLAEFDWTVALVSSSMFILVSPQQPLSRLTKRMPHLEVCFRLALRSALVLPLLSLLVLLLREGKFLQRSVVNTV